MTTRASSVCAPVVTHTHAHADPEERSETRVPDLDSARGRAHEETTVSFHVYVISRAPRFAFVFLCVVTFLPNAPHTHSRLSAFFQLPLSLPGGYVVVEFYDRDGGISRAIMIAGHQLFAILTIVLKTRVRERIRAFEIISMTHSRHEVRKKCRKFAKETAHLEYCSALSWPVIISL